MPSSRINLAGELPPIEHRQERTQALMASHAQAPISQADLLRAQALDLVDDVEQSGHDQKTVLMMCMEAIRHLGWDDALAQNPEQWTWEGLGLVLDYTRGLMPGNGDFVAVDLKTTINALDRETLAAALNVNGPATAEEEEDGLPDPERLVMATSIAVLKGYCVALDGALHARYMVEDQVILATAVMDPPAGRRGRSGA